MSTDRLMRKLPSKEKVERYRKRKQEGGMGRFKVRGLKERADERKKKVGVSRKGRIETVG